MYRILYIRKWSGDTSSRCWDNNKLLNFVNLLLFFIHADQAQPFFLFLSKCHNLRPGRTPQFWVFTSCGLQWVSCFFQNFYEQDSTCRSIFSNLLILCARPENNSCPLYYLIPNLCGARRPLSLVRRRRRGRKVRALLDDLLLPFDLRLARWPSSLFLERRLEATDEPPTRMNFLCSFSQHHT